MILYEDMKPIEHALLHRICVLSPRPVTSLGHQVGRRVFCEGPTFLNYVQHIFQGGGDFGGGVRSLPLVTGLLFP